MIDLYQKPCNKYHILVYYYITCLGLFTNECLVQLYTILMFIHRIAHINWWPDYWSIKALLCVRTCSRTLPSVCIRQDSLTGVVQNASTFLGPSRRTPSGLLSTTRTRGGYVNCVTVSGVICVTCLLCHVLSVMCCQWHVCLLCHNVCVKCHQACVICTMSWVFECVMSWMCHVSFVSCVICVMCHIHHVSSVSHVVSVMCYPSHI